MYILVANFCILRLGCSTRMHNKKKHDFWASEEIMEVSSWLHPILALPWYVHFVKAFSALLASALQLKAADLILVAILRSTS